MQQFDFKSHFNFFVAIISCSFTPFIIPALIFLCIARFWTKCSATLLFSVKKKKKKHHLGTQPNHSLIIRIWSCKQMLRFAMFMLPNSSNERELQQQSPCFTKTASARIGFQVIPCTHENNMGSQCHMARPDGSADHESHICANN